MKEQLLTTLENSRNYTLNVANAMPDKNYSFKPTEEVWNFNELLNHIAYGIRWWEENMINGNKMDWTPPTLKNKKQEVVQILNEAYDAVKKNISNAKLTDKQVQGFYATLDHITHHRGQAITYLRCNGITPPEYVY